MEYYRVKDRLLFIPRDHHQYGYEDKFKFSEDLHRLHRRWKGWTGRTIDRRHGFVRLRFVGVYNDANDQWLPDFMVERVPEPVSNEQPDDSTEELLDEIFGFD